MSTTTTTNTNNNNETSENQVKDWKDLTLDDLVRGETPSDIAEKSLQLCRDYVGGVWLKATTTEDIVVTRIKGGLTNQLYKIELAENIAAGHVETEDEPHALALKWYEPKHILFYDNNNDEFERLPDAIILSLAAEHGLSPKVYGVFPEGFLQRFHEHEQFRIKHQQRPELVKQAAIHLTKIHRLRVPLAKEQNPGVKSIYANLKSAYEKYDIEGIFRKHQLETFLKHDIREEAKFIEKLVNDIDSSTVFCHNDFRSSNILVTQPDEKILVCDMEYSRYGPRGVDFASIMSEWGFELFDYDYENFTSDDIIKAFVQYYVDEMDKLEPGYAHNPKNSVDNITKEVKAYILFYIFFFLSFFLSKEGSFISTMNTTKEDDLKQAEIYYKSYIVKKGILIKDGTINV